ncbi:MAG: response regulator transcription factor [Bacillota bacterium]
MRIWSVMLVDDEPAVVEGLRDHVDWASLGVEVACTAFSGREALALFDRHQPDIVITDIYMPGMDGLELMEAIHARAPHTTFVVLSGYDTFEYARRSLQFGAVDYMLKPATLDEMTAVIARAVEHSHETGLRRRLEKELPSLREYFMLRLLREEPDPEEAQFLGLVPLLQGPYSVAIVGLDRPPGMSEEDWQLARLTVREAASGERVYVLPSFGHEIPILLHRPHDPEGWCEALLQTMQASCPAQVTIGLSYSCASAREAYSQAREALGYKEILGAGRLIAGERVALEPDMLPPFQLERNRSLLEAMRFGDAPETSRLVREMFTALEKAPLSYLRGIAIELYGLAATALSERGQSIEDLCSVDQFWAKVGTTAGVHEISECVEGKLCEVAARLNVRRDTRHQRVVKEIEQLIAAQYGDDLTLESLARSVFLSRTYVAWLFKQVKGCSFLEYLTRYRMEKAKELLMTTDHSIYEVAEKVGYKNAAYFSRLFREHFGTMPSELRRVPST